MADDANEDSWLYGTSNPDSTTNEEERLVENSNNEAAIEKISSQDLVRAENEALAAVIQGDGVNNLNEKDIPAGDELVDFEDPAHEMEEDEEAAAGATVADTTDIDDAQTKNNEEPTADEDGGENDEDDDDSDDDINVVIGDIKAAPGNYNINKRSNLLAGAGQEKSKSTNAGKFSIEDFEGVGSINGVAAHEFSIDSLEDKPWRKPGADITDYFNYGFNEETWRSYCERQKRFRVAESGIGLASLTQNLNPQIDRQSDNNMLTGAPPGILPSGPIPIGSLGEQVQMPPPGMMQQSGMHQGSHQGMPPRFASMPRGPRPVIQPGMKENAIQVMTAECREYSRPGQMPPNFVGQGPGEEAFFHEPEPFDYGYEPTQDSQWGNDNVNWAPSGVKELTPGPNSGPSQQLSGSPGILPTPMSGPPPQMGGPPPQIRHPHPQPPMMGGMPPPNMGLGPPMGMMMGPGGPPMHMPMGPPRMMGANAPHDRSDDERERRRRERDWERERERERDKESRGRRERSRSREKSRRRSKSREKERDKDREKERDRDRDRERERDRDRDRSEKVEDTDRSDEERERRRRDRERERERERSRRDRSRSREKSRRRSKSRDKERERTSKTGASSSSSSSRSEKKKTHRKEDEE